MFRLNSAENLMMYWKKEIFRFFRYFMVNISNTLQQNLTVIKVALGVVSWQNAPNDYIPSDIRGPLQFFWGASTLLLRYWLRYEPVAQTLRFWLWILVHFWYCNEKFLCVKFCQDFKGRNLPWHVTMFNHDISIGFSSYFYSYVL